MVIFSTLFLILQVILVGINSTIIFKEISIFNSLALNQIRCSRCKWLLIRIIIRCSNLLRICNRDIHSNLNLHQTTNKFSSNLVQAAINQLKFRWFQIWTNLLTILIIIKQHLGIRNKRVAKKIVNKFYPLQITLISRLCQIWMMIKLLMPKSFLKWNK